MEIVDDERDIDEFSKDKEAPKTRYCTVKDGPMCGPLNHKHLWSKERFDYSHLQSTYEYTLSKYQKNLKNENKGLKAMDTHKD
jgi:hypothetical protein